MFGNPPAHAAIAAEHDGRHPRIAIPATSERAAAKMHREPAQTARMRCVDRASSGKPVAVRAPSTTVAADGRIGIRSSPRPALAPRAADRAIAGVADFLGWSLGRGRKSPGCRIDSSSAFPAKIRDIAEYRPTPAAPARNADHGNRPVKYQRNSPSIARQSTGRHNSGR